MKLINITLAVQRMEPMRQFYAHLLGITFQERKMYGATLYAGNWGDMEWLLCPAEIAGNTAVQNRHQLEFSVPDIRKSVETALQNEGEKMGDITENERAWSIGLKDPDKNTLVLTQLK